MLYLPNELVNLIYIQSIWLLVGDKKRLFKDIHQDIKDNYIGGLLYTPLETQF